jgi:hypothetical protein
LEGVRIVELPVILLDFADEIRGHQLPLLHVGEQLLGGEEDDSLKPILVRFEEHFDSMVESLHLLSQEALGRPHEGEEVDAL